MNGVPYFAISIALYNINKVIAGIVYDLVHNDIYWAEEGIGAYLNDQRLRVTKKNLDNSLIALGIPFLGRGDHKNILKFKNLLCQK